MILNTDPDDGQCAAWVSNWAGSEGKVNEKQRVEQSQGGWKQGCEGRVRKRRR